MIITGSKVKKKRVFKKRIYVIFNIWNAIRMKVLGRDCVVHYFSQGIMGIERTNSSGINWNPLQNCVLLTALYREE